MITARCTVAETSGRRPYGVRVPSPVWFVPETSTPRSAMSSKRFRRLRCQDADLGLGDIGVFAPSNDLVDRAISCFADAELACQPLTEYEGQSNAAIKVGTFNRAKGLEFKVVFLLDLSVFPKRRRPAKAAAENEERLALHVSQLFVAMTRARDGLFLLCGDGPSDVIAKAIEHFEDTGGSRPGG